MPKTLGRLKGLFKDPAGFFNDVRNENWKPAFVFFLWTTIIISVVTHVANYLGIESTKFSKTTFSKLMGLWPS